MDARTGVSDSVDPLLAATTIVQYTISLKMSFGSSRSEKMRHMLKIKLMNEREGKRRN